MKLFWTLLFFFVFVLPIVAIGLLSLSPTTGMDFYQNLNISFQWWKNLLSDASWRDAVISSLTVATVSSTFAIALTLPPAAYFRLTRKMKRFQALGLAGFSFCVPPVILAVGMYIFTSKVGVFDTIFGLAVAHLSYTVPITLYVLLEGFRKTPLFVFQVARSLGAQPVRAALTWIFETQRQTIVAAIGASILISLSEVTMTLYVTDVKVDSISRWAISGISRNLKPTGFAAMTLWVILVAFVFAPIIRPILEERDRK